MRILGHDQTPPPPLYAFVCISVDPPPPIDAYIINGRPPCFYVLKIKLDCSILKIIQGINILGLFILYDHVVIMHFVYFIMNHWPLAGLSPILCLLTIDTKVHN